MHENFLHGVFFKCGYKPLVMERSANITNCRCTVSELLCITYITSCSVCVCVCACMLQSQGSWLPFAPASTVRAIWWRSRTNTLGVARHPCWHASRGGLGRLPVLCLLLHECTDRCRWNRQCSHISADKFTPAPEIHYYPLAVHTLQYQCQYYRCN